MRFILALVLMAACGGSGVSPADSGVDVEDLPPASDLAAKPGQACIGAGFCAEYDGWCTAGRCREFCSPVATPRCPDGTHEMHSTLGGADTCVCVP